jgi:hypothetical protein
VQRSPRPGDATDPSGRNRSARIFDWVNLMPATKTFETQFKIGAKFTGQSAFAVANKAIDAVERNAKSLGTTFSRVDSQLRSIGKITVGAAGCPIQCTSS